MPRKLPPTRTKAAERARYTGMSPSEFGAAVGVSAETVRSLIGGGWFGWTRDARGNQVPECMDARGAGSRRAEYRIHPNAVERFFEERAITEPRGRAAS